MQNKEKKEENSLLYKNRRLFYQKIHKIGLANWLVLFYYIVMVGTRKK